MKVFIEPSRPDVSTNGKETYINNLINYLKKNHTLCDVPDKCDIAFTYRRGKKYGIPTLRHIHSPFTFLELSKDIYEFWDITDVKPIVSVNCEYHKELLEKDNSKNQVYVLPNCIDDEYYSKKMNVRKKKKSIIYLGNLREDNKNVFLPIIKLMKHLPDYTLNIVGMVRDEVKYIKDMATPNIKFVGEVINDEKKLKLIQRHEIGIGTGRCAMEMVLLGLPVLVFKVGYAGWITDDNVEKLKYDNYTARTFDKISEDDKIEKIIEDIKKNPKFMSNKKATQIFGMSKNIHIYEDTFRKVIENE